LSIKPVYENKKAPCFSSDHLGQSGCPALNDIPGFLFAISQKNFPLAFEILKQTNPFSGGCGRFCDHPCESACNREKFDSAVNIRDLERFISDYAITHNIAPPSPEKKIKKSVAIIGAGPAGLSSAWFLNREGYHVEVFERESLAGGMMAQGIPLYRYPTEVLQWETNYLIKAGITIHLNKTIDREGFKELSKKFNYTVVATGAHKPRKLAIPGETLEGVETGVAFLKKINLNSRFRSRPDPNEHNILPPRARIAVIGGGYTAIDVARTAVRFGATVTVFYRRGEEAMGIHPGEVIECEKEGITFQFYQNPKEIEKDDKQEKLLLTLEKMLPGELGPDGKTSIIPTGQTKTYPFDRVIKAIGETPDLKFLPEGYEINGSRVMLDNSETVYIAGDARFGYAQDVGMVVRAIGSGRKTADQIIGEVNKEEKQRYMETKTAFYPTIKKRYFKKQARVLTDTIALPERVSTFNEVFSPLNDFEAITAASRCFYCGICIQCDWCYQYSRGSIAKVEKEWDGKRDSLYFAFIEENFTPLINEAVEGCPRNAMGFVNTSSKPVPDYSQQYFTLSPEQTQNKKPVARNRP